MLAIALAHRNINISNINYIMYDYNSKNKNNVRKNIKLSLSHIINKIKLLNKLNNKD